jgi:hypothetical protein
MKCVSVLFVAKHGIISTLMFQIDFFFQMGFFDEALLTSQKPIPHRSHTEHNKKC